MSKHPIYLFVLSSLLASCVPVLTPVAACTTDADCEAGLSCQVDRCLPRPSTCGAGETRPCGPAPIGACKQGVQRCVDGMFETACGGEVTAVSEACNAIDDDCDGEVDEGVLTPFYVDRDGDGVGSSAAGAETRMACTQPAGFAPEATDCDDVAASINPAAVELCDAAEVDENCNGTANEDCGCPNIGMTQVCCASRGTQTCVARDGGGGLLSACTVMASTELCNGVDDDCDGQADELYSLSSPDGGSVVLTDGSTIELDGGCTVGLGACARSGGSACVSGSLSCNAVAGTPGIEICNTIDDDCDGQVDEASATLCAVTGQLCTGGSCACPSSQSICGSSCQSVGGSCSTGTGACARQGSVLCTNGTAACDAVAGTPGTETCNNIDDDCDGQTDEASATLCPATGQTCSLGTCACPGGQSVCGTSCQTLGGTCSTGVGACNRTGAIACISGGASCNATAGSPVAETCDGIDNDCDGTNDNGVTITCYPDGDNDQYATSATASQQCPDAARASFGNCPAGFVAPAASLGIDCAATDVAAWRMVSTLADADGDTHCLGPEQTLCVGTSAPAGRRFATACVTSSDCNDANGGVFQFLEVRVDADADGYCVGSTSFQCAGSAPAAGTRIWTTCQATDDCNDVNSGTWVAVSTRADADSDTFCLGAAATTCIGSSVPTGRRLAGQCAVAPDDCNDANAALFTSRVVRDDADNDTYCAGAASGYVQCGGSAPFNGTRLATTCQGLDCRDSNPNATTTCYLPGAYLTTSATKQCGIGIPPSEGKTVAPGSCPTGFSRILAPYLGAYSGNAGGVCTVTSDQSLIMSCGSLVFGAFSCSIQGDCSAD